MSIILSGDINLSNSSSVKGLKQVNEELNLTEKIFIRSLNKYKKIYIKFMKIIEEYRFYEIKIKHIEDLNDFVRCFSTGVNDFLKIKNNRKYILYKSNGYTLQSKISQLVNSIVIHESDDTCFNKDNIQNLILNLTIEVNGFLEWFSNYASQVEIKAESDEIIEKLKKKESEYVESINLANSKQTEEIYSGASIKYLKFARIYDFCSYVVLIIILLIGSSVFRTYPLDDINILNFFMPKLLIITTLVTLATIFLRKASRLRKLHDQANQTSLELQALPLYLRNIDESEHSEIYKNLAAKYFGKDIDQNQNDKDGNLLKDQLSAGTELVKASVEMIKASKNTQSLK